MEHMNEDEFERLIFECDPSKCDHPKIVMIYNAGWNTDFGCIKCGFCHTNRHAFNMASNREKCLKE